MAAPGPTVGYSGTVPSVVGQGLIGKMRGKRLTVGAGAGLAVGVWTVDGFGVVPNPVTGKGPVVLLKDSAGKIDYVPVDTDADVADLFERVTGAPPVAGPSPPAGQRYLARVGPRVKNQ